MNERVQWISMQLAKGGSYMSRSHVVSGRARVSLPCSRLGRLCCVDIESRQRYSISINVSSIVIVLVRVRTDSRALSDVESQNYVAH